MFDCESCNISLISRAIMVIAGALIGQYELVEITDELCNHNSVAQ